MQCGFTASRYFAERRIRAGRKIEGLLAEENKPAAAIFRRLNVGEMRRAVTYIIADIAMDGARQLFMMPHVTQRALDFARRMPLMAGCFGRRGHARSHSDAARRGD